MTEQNDVNPNFTENEKNDDNAACGCSSTAGSSGGKGKIIAFILIMLLAFGVAAHSIMNKGKSSASTCGACPDKATASQGAMCNIEKAGACPGSAKLAEKPAGCPISAQQIKSSPSTTGTDAETASAEKTTCSAGTTAACCPTTTEEAK